MLRAGSLSGKRVLSSPFPSILSMFFPQFHDLFDGGEPHIFSLHFRVLWLILSAADLRKSKTAAGLPANSHHYSFWLLRIFQVTKSLILRNEF